MKTKAVRVKLQVPCVLCGKMLYTREQHTLFVRDKEGPSRKQVTMCTECLQVTIVFLERMTAVFIDGAGRILQNNPIKLRRVNGVITVVDGSEGR